MPQVQDIFEPLTVLENLEMGGYLLPAATIRARVPEVVEVFPALKPMLKRRADKLSGGERKMLAIARVLMLDPKVLILDEPTANLAPQLADKLLREQVQRPRRAGQGGAARRAARPRRARDRGVHVGSGVWIHSNGRPARRTPRSPGFRGTVFGSGDESQLSVRLGGEQGMKLLMFRDGATRAPRVSDATARRTRSSTSPPRPTVRHAPATILDVIDAGEDGLDRLRVLASSAPASADPQRSPI